MKTSRKINLKDSLILMIGLISLNGFCPPVNSQPSPVPINENRSQTERQKSQADDFNEISILDQILLGCLPILIGMGSMALFTFLLTFLNQYSINCLINLQKSIQADSLEKKSYPKS
jgi:hypothetical protein